MLPFRLLGGLSLSVQPLRYSRWTKALGLRGVAGVELGGVPLELLAHAVGDIPQVIGLGQPARIGKSAGRRRAGLAGVNPLGVVAQRLGDERLRAV